MTVTTHLQETAAYQLLEPFTGKWQTTGKILATADQPDIAIKGTDTYEWLPGGYFLLHTVDVLMGDEKNQAIEIIGFDKQNNNYPMRFFDNKGNTTLMHGSYQNGTWTILGESERFTGKFSEDGQTISGIWEHSTDGKNWEHFMDIHLKKQ